MASLFQLTIQPLLTLLNASVEAPTENIAFMNATQNTTASATPLTMPTTFSSFLAFLYSFSALHDYFKLIVLGGAFETLRRLYSSSYTNLVNRFFVTATFDSHDISFQWMMFWLSSLPQFRQFRDFSVSTSSFSLDDDSDDTLDIDDTVDEELRRRTRAVRYLPSYNSSYWMWYKGRYITISRTKEENMYMAKSTLEITVFSRDRLVLDSLILEARRKWLSARSDKIDIFASEGFSDDWNHVASRPKRSMNSIVLDEGVKELLLEDARDFLKSKQWYADRGIPFRRGYLLYGAPGSGKTSIIHCLAGELGLDVYIISLSKSGLDDSTLNSLITSLPEQCIAIMEDIDAAFTHGITRDVTGTELEDPRRRDLSRRGPDDPREEGRNDHQGPKESDKSSRVTLSGLLNALDGISAQEGRLLFATTNRYQALDPALIRPGRMDLHVEFRLASQYQARELYKRFYIPEAAKEATAHEDEGEDEDEASNDTGYITPPKEGSNSTPSVSKSVESNEPPQFRGTAHSTCAPKLSKKKIEQLAEQFSSRIPERELSMASLQGYLMSYKIRPFQAVDDIERWVKETREKQDPNAETRTVAVKA